VNTINTSYVGLKDLFDSSAKVLAYLPVGCTEQHGPVLPLATDTIVAEGLTKALCEYRKERDSEGIIFPAISYSPSRSNINYPGSTSIEEEPFRLYVAQVCESVLRHPFHALAIVCTHGPAEPSLIELAFRINHQQLESGNGLRPVIVLGITRFMSVFARHLRNSLGKHADCKEFLLLHKIMGSDYFSSDRMEILENFNLRYRQTKILDFVIPGIPMQYRSVDGVIGSPLPVGDIDYAKVADELWCDLVATLSENIERALLDLEKL